jgi:hypothetical protein
MYTLTFPCHICTRLFTGVGNCLLVHCCLANRSRWRDAVWRSIPCTESPLTHVQNCNDDGARSGFCIAWRSLQHTSMWTYCTRNHPSLRQLHICTFERSHALPRACMHVCVHACVHACVRVCMSVRSTCMYVFVHVCLCAWMSVCLHGYMPVCRCAYKHPKILHNHKKQIYPRLSVRDPARRCSTNIDEEHFSSANEVIRCRDIISASCTCACMHACVCVCGCDGTDGVQSIHCGC